MKLEEKICILVFLILIPNFANYQFFSPSLPFEISLPVLINHQILLNVIRFAIFKDALSVFQDNVMCNRHEGFVGRSHARTQNKFSSFMLMAFLLEGTDRASRSDIDSLSEL